MTTLKESMYLRRAVVLSGPCFYCHAKAKHADHIDATAIGGKEAAENLIPTCAKCNCKKGHRMIAKAVRAAALLRAFINAPDINDVAACLLASSTPQWKKAPGLYDFIYKRELAILSAWRV